MITLQNHIYFHIGYHRTGTTFLQRSILPQYKELAILSLPQGPFRFLARYFIEDSNSNKEEDYLENGIKEIQSYVDQSNKPIIVSSEDLSGNYLSDNLDMAKKIHSIFPNSKIIICIRSQYTMIPSLYQYVYIKSGGSLAYSEYLNEIIKNNKLNYYDFVTKYLNTFCEGSVKVLLFEDLMNNKVDFFNDFFDFIDLPKIYNFKIDRQYTNSRYSLMVTKGSRLTNSILNTNSIIRFLFRNNPNRTIRIRRFSRYLFSKLDSINRKLNLLHLRPYEQFPDFRKLIYEHYKESNNKLFRLLHIDHNKYNYPL